MTEKQKILVADRRLSSARRLRKKFVELETRQRELIELSQSVRGLSYDGMPRGTGYESTIEKYAVLLDENKNAMIDVFSEFLTEVRRIEQLIQPITDDSTNNDGYFLDSYYVGCRSVEEIAKMSEKNTAPNCQMEKPRFDSIL